MTTTKALAKLYKTITGKSARNSIGNILSDLADNWAGSVPAADDVENAIAIPDLPTAAGDYKLTVAVADGTATYSWTKIT